MSTGINTVRNQILPFLILLLLLWSDFVFAQHNKKDNDFYFSVIKVVDGDTFWIDDSSGKGLKVRLIGVDAPESRNTGNKVKGYYGKEASEYLTSLIGGRKVGLEYDIDSTDQYGRTLAYVYLEDGTFVNANLLKNGYAMIMTVPPNVKYVDYFIKISRKARKRGKGLWGADN
ncbi:MAG: thermonuclease family protein [Bacteroidales bacterium]|nr:thermonuclease family protein [Bacteroidales bacterium]